MKVRIGVALGAAATPAGFTDAVRELETRGIDSLWLSELVYGPLIEPVVGWAHALAVTQHLKVGTGVAILPGRHPVLVAKQLASLAALAPRRVLPVFGLHAARPAERAVFPVPPGRRGAVFDESLHLLRRLLREPRVSFEGEFFTVTDAAVGPLPERPLDIWLGGSGPAALRRVGRFGDGWLAALITPDEARAARLAIQAAAAEAGRAVEEDHFGISLAVAPHGVADTDLAAVRRRRPDADPADLLPADWPGTRDRILRYIDAGLSKFVVRPSGDLPLEEFLDGFDRELVPLQT